jgi:hypothetical protein
MNAPFTLYDYLSFLLPGGTVLFAAFYGYFGWPYPEPGTTGLLGIGAACFVVGHVVAAAASFFEPLIWLKRPGSRQDPTWGMFGEGGTYDESERTEIEDQFRTRFGALPFQTAYRRGYTLLQHEGKDETLQVFNRQLGFYRNMTVATVIALLVVVGYNAGGRRELPLEVWGPLFVLAAVLFAYRYRRFWRRFGDGVVRGVSVLPIPDKAAALPATSTSQGDSAAPK